MSVSAEQHMTGPILIDTIMQSKGFDKNEAHDDLFVRKCVRNINCTKLYKQFKTFKCHKVSNPSTSINLITRSQMIH